MRKKASRRFYLAALMGSVALAGISQPAMAQTAKAERNFDIPAGDLGGALRAFADATGLQMVFSTPVVDGQRSSGVKGAMSPSDALTRLLAGTGLSANIAGNTATIEGSRAGADGELVTGAVQVEGVQGSQYFGGAGQAAGVNGTNGSSDITATEGTGSFTSGALTIGSKAPQAMKDVPQSISVLTSERLEQQNVTDFTSAMRQLPGVTLVQQNTSMNTAFYSRGYQITNFQLDGGAPLSTDLGFQPQIDMSVYDHVELLRGASGLFNGYGTPGGIVNLVRKKPLDHAQFVFDAQAGSWSNYRVVADATSPLALDGHLRGRLVMTYQANHYFYDTAKDNKTLVYGIAELDLTPTTLVTAGINYTRQNSVPWGFGLPRYQDGTDLKLPRSTCFCFPWNRWNLDTREIFGAVEQKIGDDWNLKFNVTQNRQSTDRKLGSAFGAIDPTTLRGTAMDGQQYLSTTDQFSAEVVLNGAFQLFGNRQEIIIGANRSTSNADGSLSSGSLVAGTADAPYRPYPGGPEFYYGSPDGSYPPIDVFNFDPENPLYNEPPAGVWASRQTKYRISQSGVYMNLRLTAFDRLHLMTGLRWSRYATDTLSDYLCTDATGDCAGKQVGVDAFLSIPLKNSTTEFSWPPPVNLSFDATKNLTFYAGYTDIYVSQGRTLTVDGKPLPPITGGNWEGGVKWASKDGRLNVALSAYRMTRKGFATFLSGSTYFEDPNGNSCCYVASPDNKEKSSGIDLDISGEISRGWQISASYNYNDNKYVSVSPDRPLTSIQPHHLYKLWMSYDFGAAGHTGVLSGLTVSGGVNGQSSGFYSGTVCTSGYYAPYPEYPSYLVCNTPKVPYNFTVPPYAVASARIDYKLSDKWSLAVNLENIFDKTYYQSVGQSVDYGNWYGTPRSVTASLRAKW
ncbi:MAG: TonB-dependent siderophore receptor [Novosphingobium sp.]|nr:TonB-dependent siderophore receptor [Novosphingobium sp.]